MRPLHHPCSYIVAIALFLAGCSASKRTTQNLAAQSAINSIRMWLGGPNNEFIQSAGRVQISSFNTDAPNYDGSELHRFIRAKRITPKDALYDLRTSSFY